MLKILFIFDSILEFIQPVMLPKKSSSHSSYVGEMAWVSGWGKANDNSTTVSRFLRYIEVPVIKNNICRAYYFFGAVLPTNICVSSKGGRSPCSGDSGGPLVYKDKSFNYLIGITSFGIAFGCEKGYPGVFTRTTEYLNWIEDTTGVVNL